MTRSVAFVGMEKSDRDAPSEPQAERSVECMLIIDREGSPVDASKVDGVLPNILQNDDYRSIHDKVRGCFFGRAFTVSASVPIPGVTDQIEPVRVRGVPLDKEPEVYRKVALVFERAPLPAVVSPPLSPAYGEYEFVVRTMRQGIWRLNTQGVIEFVNPYLAEWLESTEEALLGRHCSEYLRLTLPSIDPVVTRESSRYEAEFLTEKGLARRAIVTATALMEGGQQIGTTEIITDITAEHAVKSRLVSEVQKMASLASRDPLTGLPNRRSFDAAFQQALSMAGEHPFGLLMLDLDDLKKINDTYGHPAGDEVIREFANRLSAVVRDADDVARLGGDEFAAIIMNVGADDLRELAARLHERLTFQVTLQRKLVTVTASFGVSHSSERRDDMLAAADEDMYAYKRGRKPPTET